jgi:hypothetical protein
MPPAELPPGEGSGVRVQVGSDLAEDARRIVVDVGKT